MYSTIRRVRSIKKNGEGSMRKNSKRIITNFNNSIKKSNELSLARLNAQLSLNQMQLLAYAIFSTQSVGLTTFNKHEFEKKFELKQYRTDEAHIDSKKLFDLSFAIVDLDEDEFEFLRVFQRISYRNGQFEFEWSNALLPHIFDLKQNFVLTDLAITSKFKSGFSWILYDYLKINYGAWYKTLSKEEIMRLFNVENKQTYVKNTSELKRGVIDVAISEINKLTEYECWYTEKKIGNKITHFTIHFSIGKNETGATEKQLALLRSMYDSVMNDMLSFITLENDSLVLESRKLLQFVQSIDNETKKGDLTTKKADLHIKNMKVYIKQLESIKKKDKKMMFIIIG